MRRATSCFAAGVVVAFALEARAQAVAPAPSYALLAAVRPTFRAGIGPGFLVTPGALEPALAGMVMAGVWLEPGDVSTGRWRLQLRPEGGLAYALYPGYASVFATMGVGVGATNQLWSVVAWQPSLLVGTGGGEFTVGMRNAVRFEVLAGTFALEVAHQFYPARGILQNEFHVVLTGDPVPLIYLLRAIARWRP